MKQEKGDRYTKERADRYFEITTATSLVWLLPSLLLSGNARSIQIDRQSLGLLCSATIVALIGQLATFIALNTGQISVVAPVINTTRLFAIALTALSCAAKRKLTASN